MARSGSREWRLLGLNRRLGGFTLPRRLTPLSDGNCRADRCFCGLSQRSPASWTDGAGENPIAAAQPGAPIARLLPPWLSNAGPVADVLLIDENLVNVAASNHQVCHRRPPCTTQRSRSCWSHTRPAEQRRAAIFIEPAAPPEHTVPRVPSLKGSERRPRACGDALGRPASRTLDMSGHVLSILFVASVGVGLGEAIAVSGGPRRRTRSRRRRRRAGPAAEAGAPIRLAARSLRP